MKHTEYIIPIGEEAKEFDEIFIGVLRKHKELIRCKDCKYWGEDGYFNGCKYATCIMQEQDYCSMAERRTE